MSKQMVIKVDECPIKVIAVGKHGKQRHYVILSSNKGFGITVNRDPQEPDPKNRR